MDTDDTSAVDPTRRCHLCHRILSSETETHGSLESTGICNNCNFLFSEDNITTRTRDGDIFPYDAYDSDSDASVDVDTYLNHDDDDDDDDVDDGHDENTVGGSVGRIQLHRSLATNGRNRPNDWLREILSDEGIRNSERRRLFSILDDQVLDTSGYGDYVDVETNGSRLGAPPAADWFVKNLEPVIVDEPGSVCVICKDNVCVGSVVNRLPCGHVYHPSCIVPWLNARNTCPLCRYELPTDDKDRSRQESEVQRALAASGGRRWWFVVAPVVSVVVIAVLWLGGGVFGGQRDDRSVRWWSLFVNE
ncbi:putative transcription factor C2H2 family [Helianthus annuus]|nr:putative transcription factor C2H2 family [Helianthus annuus]